MTTIIVVLTYDEFPGYDQIQKMSTAITNALPISRVIYSVTHHVVCTEEAQFIVPNKPR